MAVKQVPVSVVAVEPVERRHCRNCVHFLRVAEKNYPTPEQPRGFCVLGEGTGDFSLRVSSSVASSCPMFVQDPSRVAQTSAEDDFAARKHKFADRLCSAYAKEHGVSPLEAHWQAPRFIRDFKVKHAADAKRLREGAQVDETRYLAVLAGLRTSVRDLFRGDLL